MKPLNKLLYDFNRGVSRDDLDVLLLRVSSRLIKSRTPGVISKRRPGRPDTTLLYREKRNKDFFYGGVETAPIIKQEYVFESSLNSPIYLAAKVWIDGELRREMIPTKMFNIVPRNVKPRHSVKKNSSINASSTRLIKHKYNSNVIYHYNHDQADFQKVAHTLILAFRNLLIFTHYDLQLAIKLISQANQRGLSNMMDDYFISSMVRLIATIINNRISDIISGEYESHHSNNLQLIKGLHLLESDCYPVYSLLDKSEMFMLKMVS